MEIDGMLEGLQPYVVHDTRFYRVFYSHTDAPDEILRCQLPVDALDPALKPGDRITVTYLLRTVMRVRSRKPEAVSGQDAIRRVAEDGSDGS